MTIKEAIHRNRDENSFTSRLFEASLIPKISSSGEELKRFCETLNAASKRCKGIVDKQSNNKVVLLNIPKGIKYVDSMLFLEATDWYAAYGKPAPNRTEFDAVVILQDTSDYIGLVFEVKCFQSIDPEEIERQHDILEKMEGIIADHEEKEINFSHILLISEHLLTSERSILSQKTELNSTISIITWNDLKCFIPENRISQKDLENYKTISNDGIGSNLWSLV
jgi:hypothetical protein